MRKLMLVIPFAIMLMALGCQNVADVQSSVDELSKKVTALEQKVEKLTPTTTTEKGGKVEVATAKELKELKDEIAGIKKDISAIKKDLGDLRSRYESHLKKYHK